MGVAQHASPVGALLAGWRRRRQLSQLALAGLAEISPRHLCFVETGRSRPSREMVLLLASALDVPLRERNELLLAAGFAPVYPQSALDAETLGAVRGALDAILRQQEPFPAIVMNRGWDIVRTNEGGRRFFAMLLDGRPPPQPPNVLRTMFDPRGARPHVVNWEQVARALLRRVDREAIAGVQGEATERVLEEIRRYPGVPSLRDEAAQPAPLLPVLPVSFEKNGRRFDFFSAITTLGTPQDVTVQEIRIESFFPANDATDRAARAL